MYLYGASSHGKVIMDILTSHGISVDGFVDDNKELIQFSGLPVSHSAQGKSPMIVSIGDCQTRKKIVSSLGPIEFVNAVHMSAIIAKSSVMGKGNVVMAGTIIQPGVVLGDHCIVNTGAVVDHDCRISDYVHIAPHCTLCGDVSIGEGTWVGAGTTIIQGIHIGKNCYIGAGSVVIKDIPDNSLAYGNPCLVKKSLE